LASRPFAMITELTNLSHLSNATEMAHVF
jgi:hypothetical protein